MFSIYINSSFNNTHLSIYYNKRIVFKASSGMSSIRGSFKKNSNMSLIMLGVHAANFLESFFNGKPRIIFYFSGLGKGKFYILKAFQKFQIEHCYFSASVPFNGCRQKKKRRL
nr:ribosomal protein S11 [Schizochytrium sp. TIO1101]